MMLSAQGKRLVTVILAVLFLSTALISAAAAATVWNKPLRDPLKHRIVSFHRGRANKDLIRRSAELGFNGVMFQLEGGNVEPLKGFAERNKKEGYIDLCHSLGMDVTLWIHELSDIAGKDDPNYLGPVSVENEKLWNHISDRYDWVLGELLPDIDGLVLTVSETQIWVTEADLMRKLASTIDAKCRKYNKDFIVRTFVHHPDQFVGVMDCAKSLPEDIVIMTKCVPQDWQMRGMHDKAIGDIGNHDQIIEYDIAGEYFLKNRTANCMPELLKEQFDYGLTKGVDGICVRVDRDDDFVLEHPAEVNLWALGMLAGGNTDSVEDVWNAWATARYGKDAAPGVIKALENTQYVVTELLNVGTFSYGDTRSFPRSIDRDAFHTNWANVRWDPEKYTSEYQLALAGDPEVIRANEQAKVKAMQLAEQALVDLEQVKGKLTPEDYDILYTKLLTNKVSLEWRAPIMMAYLRYRRILNTDNMAEKQQLAKQIGDDLRTMRIVARRNYEEPRVIEYRGRTWKVGAPEDLDVKRINEWADKTEKLLTDMKLPVR